MPGERVLIVGAGVAGSILAYFLAQADYQVTVIERSKAGQKLGQGIEIESPALKVVEAMKVLDKLKAIRTSETGFNLVDEKDRSHAMFPVTGGISPTGELEMMRGELCEVLYKKADESPNVYFRFECTLQSLRQTGHSVIVDIQDRRNKSNSSEEFDFVLGADGAKSRTRDIAFGSTEKLKCLKPVGAFVAYFSIPKEPQDEHLSRLCHFTDNRIIWMRPVQKDSKVTSVYFIHCKSDVPHLQQANASGDRMEQKKAMAKTFGGLGWEAPRIVKGMMETDNFYCDELTQVKLDRWSRERVALVGDSAWAPTPFTGQGNQLAIIGAWVLAQELTRNRNVTAFDRYEERLRAYVETSQNIPLGGYAPKLCCPQTTWGIWVFRYVLGLIAWWSRLFPSSATGEHSTSREEFPFDLQIEEYLEDKKER